MTALVRRQDHHVNGTRVRRLMRLMGLQAIFPMPRTTISRTEHNVYPYLLRDRVVTQPNEVWSADSTYVPMQHGCMYLVAVLDWFSRYVLAWQLSNTLDGHFCLDALQQALRLGTPAIFNTDQGVQFTASDFTRQLEAVGIRISMDGRGRALDNVCIERLWRSVTYEDIYLKDYASVLDLAAGLERYFRCYNHDRPHQSLGYRTPAEVQHSALSVILSS